MEAWKTGLLEPLRGDLLGAVTEETASESRDWSGVISIADTFGATSVMHE